MSKRGIALILIAGLFVVGWVFSQPTVSRPTVSLSVLGITNDGGLSRLIVSITNSGAHSIHCLGAFSFRPVAGSAITMSRGPVRVPPHSSVQISGFPAGLLTNTYSISAPWEISWRWHVDQWTQSAGFIPKVVRDAVPEYHFATSADNSP